MPHKKQWWLALSMSAVLMAGCAGDENNPNDDSSTEDPDASVVDAPTSDQAPAFIVRPYLQSPMPDQMSVMFETEQAAPEVWVRPFDGEGEFRQVDATTHSSDGLVYRAVITSLESNTLYEYYVITRVGEEPQVSQRFAFKTWPKAGDDVSQTKIIALSDTQLDRDIYVNVLSNVVADGFLQHECDGDQPETCAENIAAITISGDVVQVGGNRTHWREQLFGRLAAISPYVPLVTVPGNHDYYSDAELSLYRSYMSPPETGSVDYNGHWYYLDYLDLRLVGLDSYPISGAHGSFNRETLAIQRQWLKETLYDAELRGKNFVMGMFHHGCLSELWNVGESIGSCEMVSELEDFSSRTGAITGHLFGHTHAYSRGQSRDVNHLWLNAASASGYIEPLDNADHQNNQVRDYDTFEVSRSEFGYNLLTFEFGPSPKLTLERKKGGFDGDTNFDVVDRVVFEADNNVNLPLILAGTGEQSAAALELAIQVGAPEQVHSVQWQLSEDADFSGIVYDVWGNNTRRQNLFYANADQVGGDGESGYEAVNTQEGVDIFSLDLSEYLSTHSLRVGGDDYYRWTKRYAEQNTHVSSYDKYANQPRPELSLRPGTTWYWRARVRDENMNWSVWSDTVSFDIAGTRTENLLVNGDAETGNIDGWTLEMGLMSAITAGDNGNFGASEGDYYFAGRGFGKGAPSDCCEERIIQNVDLSIYTADIDGGNVYVEFSAMLSTWSGADTPALQVIALDNSGDEIDWDGDDVLSSSSAQSWESRQVSGRLPEGTRTLRIRMGGTRKAGNDNDIYFDDLKLYLYY
ncbi:phosphohydrolase [Hahella sp. CCB-MM4]|uniref:metallophosphoesterase n=1 Tax=Hahella sp. (strain CCB-MM4) TaxID=1926491 RepID=UPI000B9BE579|nr:metallophosphoesterase [Hahella sp. CCB-MM4]OZG71598.1 phosphohydrolase [Hahella sp. CCB-MM4]